MEQVIYERPREKLQHKGVRFLTLVELVQLILGSGSAQVSGAKLARQVGHLVEQGEVSLRSLTNISGLGVAKACQILAAFELGRRMADMEGAKASPGVKGRPKASAQQSVSNAIDYGRTFGGGVVVCSRLDGAGAEIDRKVYHFHKSQHYSLLAKQLFAEALSVTARSVVVVMVTKSAQGASRSAALPSAQELGFIAAIKSVAGVVDIQVQAIVGVYKTWSTDWSTL